LIPAVRAAAPSASATLPISDSAVPSSRMKAVDSTRGVAPAIARSLTVPFTARSPIEPPGKNIGFTTKESVENAKRTPATDTMAESPIPASAAVPNAGRNRCSMSSADIAPPPP